jgi:hypothetical protein
MNLSFRHYYWRWLKNLAFLFIIFVIMMTLARTTFAFVFGEWDMLVKNLPEIKKAFFLGFRFDLMPLAYINILPFLVLHLAYFLPGKKVIKSVRLFMITFLCLGYFALAWLYVCDYGFYSYFQEHLNILFFGFFEDDTRALITTIWKNYPVPLWGSILFFVHYGLYRFIKFLFSPFEFDLKAKKFDFKVALCFFGGLVLIAFMGRGNFGRLPLSVEDSFISDNEFVNEISLNGAITLNRAIKIRKTYGMDKYDYLKNFGFADWQSAFIGAWKKSPIDTDVLKSLLAKTPANAHLKANPPHVVLVVMESFGSYWNTDDAENFQLLGELKPHFDKGLLFKNFLPAENGTIGSIVSIATSQVIRPGARFLSESEYMQTSLKSAGNIPFKESGYETHFVYGGKLGWRNLGKYLSQQQFDKLWGADEIKDAMPELNNFSARDLGNEWGIFDEYLYSFIDEQIRTATKPQFFMILTTSNHPPFEYPSSYTPKPLDLTPAVMEKITVDEALARKRFLGFQYANQKIGEFITRMNTSPVGDKVIVALTGDHSFWIAKGVEQDQEFRRYAVPFFLSVPEAYKPANVDLTKFGSHEDIFPTLYHLALSNQNYLKLGENLFGDDSHAINSTGIYANKEGAFHHGKYWKWKDLEHQLLEPAEETEGLKALVQHGHGMIGITDSYLKAEKKNTPPAGDNGRP